MLDRLLDDGDRLWSFSLSSLRSRALSGSMNVKWMLRSMNRSLVSSITADENPDPISMIRRGRNSRMME